MSKNAAPEGGEWRSDEDLRAIVGNDLDSNPTIWTVGHSTRDSEDFIAILKRRSIASVIDIRTIPRSRKNPQFNLEAIGEKLEDHGITYRHFPELGGLRRSKPDSINLGIVNDSFRGFADYMQTSEFDMAIHRLIKSSKQGRSALMCAETLPWRCHRSLISDALTVRGVHVRHIIGSGKDLEHKLSWYAHVEGVVVSYPSRIAHSGPGELQTHPF
jgi:uncharacterized protein (DUF488 family)